LEAEQMNLWHRMARVIWWIGDAFIAWGDRVNQRGTKRAEPLDFDQAVTATLRIKEISANVARNNAVFDDLQKRPKA